MNNFSLKAAASTDGKKGVSIRAYTGGLMTVPGWGLLCIDLAGIDVGGQIKLLADHTNTLAGIVGFGAARVENNQLLITGTISAQSDAGRQLIALSKDGIEFEASVGIEPKKTYTVQANKAVKVNGQNIKSEQPFTLIKTGSLREVSIVPLGCDSGTAVQIAASKKTETFEFLRKTKIMKIEDFKLIAAKYSDVLDEAAQNKLTLSAAEQSLDEVAFEKQCLAEGRLAMLRASRPSAPQGKSEGRSGDSKKVLAAAALLLTGRQTLAEKCYGALICQQAADLKCTNAQQLLQAGLTLNCKDVPRDQNDLIKAAFSTGSLTNALADSAAKSLQDGFAASPGTWEIVGEKRPVKNFHPHKMISAIVRGGQYPIVPDGGELKHVSFEDSAITHSIQTRGCILTITRQTIINDDLGAVFDLQKTLGVNAGRTINKVFWDTLKGAGAEFFDDALYGNYPTPSAAQTLSIDALASAIATTRQMKDADGNPLAASPKLLIVPPELEAGARGLIASIELRDTTSNKKYGVGNPWQGSLEVVIEPHLSLAFGGSATTWYLGLDKQIVPGIIVSFLNGQTSPTVENVDMPIDVLGIGLRAYLDFGVDLGDPRGLVKLAIA